MYYQYFCGEQELAVGEPCAATELVEFRNEYDGHTIDPALRQEERLTGRSPE